MNKINEFLKQEFKNNFDKYEIGETYWELKIEKLGEIFDNVTNLEKKDFFTNHCDIIDQDGEYVCCYLKEMPHFKNKKFEIQAFPANRYFSEYSSFEDGSRYKEVHKFQVVVHEYIEPDPIAILNTTILTIDGNFRLQTISCEEAKEIIQNKEIISAVGHESTAQILTQLLQREVTVNRINFQQKKKQKAICFKLKGRPEEGKILTARDIENIGYEFKLLEMI